MLFTKAGAALVLATVFTPPPQVWAQTAAQGDFPAFAVDRANWPSVWNTTACSDKISVPATCAELTAGFELAGVAPERYLIAPVAADGVHGVCNTAGEYVAGEDQQCGKAVFRFYCEEDAVVTFAAEGMRGHAGQYGGNTDSIWSWQDDQINRLFLRQPFSSPSAWRLGGLGAGFVARQGAHTVVFSEREDGAKLRSVALTSGFPSCHFGQPDPDRTAIPGLERQIGAISSQMNVADSSMRADIDELQSNLNTAQSNMAAMSSAMAAMSSTMATVTDRLAQPVVVVPSYTTSGSGSAAGSVPSVEAAGADVILTAPNGGVKITSRDCATVDVCELGRQMAAVTDQLNAPRPM